MDNQNENIIQERLKFYADTEDAPNQYFCYKLGSIIDLNPSIYRFLLRGWRIRAAWYEVINMETGEVLENTKLNMDNINEAYIGYLNDQVRQVSSY